jgi:ribosomal protein S26
MPVLRVRCIKCSRMIPTDFDVDLETYKNLTDTERTLECPFCEETQVWNLDDVDRSVFKKSV